MPVGGSTMIRADLALGAQLLCRPLDPGAVSAVFLAAITETSPTEALMAMQWRQAGLPIVERREMYVTPGGKILHFHTVPTVGAREVGE
jgi:hypothetical protein